MRQGHLSTSAALAAGLLGLFVAAPLQAQATGLLVVAHGAGAEWNGAVRGSVGQVRWSGPVELAFLMGSEARTAGWDSAAARLLRAGATRLVVVPLMVSSYGSHTRQIQHYAGARGELPPELAGHTGHVTPLSIPSRVTPALDDAPEVGEALADRWRELAGSHPGRPVLFVGHGPNDDADAVLWTQNLSAAGERLRTAGLRGEFRVALLRDDAPAAVKSASIAAMRDTVTALAARAGDSVTVLPAMIAPGPLTRSEIPRHLAGLPVAVVPAGLTPHAAIARWIERVAGAALTPSFSEASSWQTTAPSRP